MVGLYCFLYIWGSNKEGALAEENSPVDCFCRRGNERSEAIGALRRKTPTVSTKE